MKQILIIGVFTGCLFAQNLINNPSFEDTVNCPYSSNQLDYSQFWSSPVYYCTPDYFNVCNTNGWSDIPSSVFGYQYPRTGSACAGIVAFTDSVSYCNPLVEGDYREFIQNKLKIGLDSGKIYCGGFWVNLSNPFGTFASDQFGMTFSPDSFFVPFTVPPYFPPVWPNNPYVNNTNGLITDTLNWVLVTDTFIANGTEKWAIIGNLNRCSVTGHIQVEPDTGCYAYYYIDDVFIYEQKPVFIREGNLVVVCDSASPLTFHADNAVFYEWYLSNDPGNILSYKDSVQLNLPPGNYYLVVKGESCNYISYDSIFIEVNKCIEVIIPPGFSPNGDGINDVFKIINLSNYPENSLTVINRWGDLIYQARPYNNDWDGTCNRGMHIGNGYVTDGTYFYVFMATPASEPILGSLEIRRN